jgi:hypothetical protein
MKATLEYENGSKCHSLGNQDLSDLKGFAAANCCDRKSDDEIRAAMGD